MCDGPPLRYTMMTDLPRVRGVLCAACARSTSASVSPPTASAPAVRNARRETPSQVTAAELRLKKSSMGKPAYLSWHRLSSLCFLLGPDQREGPTTTDFDGRTSLRSARRLASTGSKAC